MYTDYPTREMNYSYPPSNPYYGNDERFFWAPFVIGGLAGTALGYGISNNNQINHPTYYPVYPMNPIYYPTFSSNTYYY